MPHRAVLGLCLALVSLAPSRAAGAPSPARPPPNLAPSPPPAPAPPRSGALRLAVLDPRSTGPVPARALAAFTQSLAPELRKLEGVSVITYAEVRELLSFEKQRQMLGCAADEACLAEIGGALGVDEILSVELTLTGTTYTLSARRLDIRKARVVQSEVRRLDQRDGEELLSAVGPLVATTFTDRTLRAGRVRGVERAVYARLNPPPLPRWTFYATAGASAAALAAAGGTAWLAHQAAEDHASLSERARTEVVPAAELKRLEDRVRGYEGTRNVLLVSGAVLAVGAGVEAFFTDWRGDRAALTVAPGLAGAGAPALVVAGRF